MAALSGCGAAGWIESAKVNGWDKTSGAAASWEVEAGGTASRSPQAIVTMRQAIAVARVALPSLVTLSPTYGAPAAGQKAT